MLFLSYSAIHENMGNLMPSTEHVIFGSVDGCFNLKCRKPYFRCVPHETHKITAKFEIRVDSMFLLMPWIHDIKTEGIWSNMDTEAYGKQNVWWHWLHCIQYQHHQHACNGTIIRFRKVHYWKRWFPWLYNAHRSAEARRLQTTANDMVEKFHTRIWQHAFMWYNRIRVQQE